MVEISSFVYFLINFHSGVFHSSNCPLSPPPLLSLSLSPSPTPLPPSLPPSLPSPPSLFSITSNELVPNTELKPRLDTEKKIKAQV